MKILFLDVDGVLNSEEEVLSLLNNKIVEDPQFPQPWRLELLKELCNKLDFKIVLSSSWRNFKLPKNSLRKPSPNNLYYKLEAALKEHGLSILDITEDGVDINKYPNKKEPDAYINCDRGAEIMEWLSRHNDVEDYLILDDEEFDIKNYTNKLYLVDSKVGLLEKDVRILINLYE